MGGLSIAEMGSDGERTVTYRESETMESAHAAVTLVSRGKPPNGSI